MLHTRQERLLTWLVPLSTRPAALYLVLNLMGFHATEVFKQPNCILLWGHRGTPIICYYKVRFAQIPLVHSISKWIPHKALKSMCVLLPWLWVYVTDKLLSILSSQCWCNVFSHIIWFLGGGIPPLQMGWMWSEQNKVSLWILETVLTNQ